MLGARYHTLAVNLQQGMLGARYQTLAVKVQLHYIRCKLSDTSSRCAAPVR